MQNLTAAILLLLAFSSCSKDDTPAPVSQSPQQEIPAGGNPEESGSAPSEPSEHNESLSPSPSPGAGFPGEGAVSFPGEGDEGQYSDSEGGNITTPPENGQGGLPGSGENPHENHQEASGPGTSPPEESSQQTPGGSTDFQSYRSYIINAGSHSTGSSFRLHSGNVLSFKAVFDNSSKYQISASRQGDMNKLFGFSDCSSQHHTNSARFGWRWYDNQLQIFAYCYTNGERQMKYITSVDPDKDYEYTIRIQGDKYQFEVNNSAVVMDRGCSDGGVKYYLYPYFGGTTTAPHQIQIRILEI